MKNEGLGLLAGFLTTTSFIPQVLRIIKTKHTKDISLPMYVMYLVGICLWIVVGVVNESLSITVWNIATFMLASIILVLKLRNG